MSKAKVLLVAFLMWFAATVFVNSLDNYDRKQEEIARYERIEESYQLSQDAR